jgi:hypothetical protein
MVLIHGTFIRDFKKISYTILARCRKKVSEPILSSSEQFSSMLTKEQIGWNQLIKQAQIKVE